MLKKNYVWVYLAIVLTLPFGVFAVVDWYEDQYKTLPILGPEGHKVSDFTLINQNKELITTADWDGKIVVADFFFTHCPSICPKMAYNLKRVQAYANVPNLLINSFTVDPERDSVSQLKLYAEKFGIKDNWYLITGEKKLLYQLARKSFMITATDGDGGPNDFIHSENLVLVDTKKRIRGYYNGTNEEAVNQLVKDIRKLGKERQ